MRLVFALSSLIVLAACSGDPKSWGLTGPGPQQAPPEAPVAAPDTSPTPGVTTTGPTYGPTFGPTGGNNGFWGYND
jgi:hypothetical protein